MPRPQEIWHITCMHIIAATVPLPMRIRRYKLLIKPLDCHLWHKPDSANEVVFHLKHPGWQYAPQSLVLIWSHSLQMYSSKFQRSSWGLHYISKSHWLEGWSRCRLPGMARKRTRQSLMEESTKRQSILTREERQASMNMQAIYIGQNIYNTYPIRAT